jgi:hypothetical protein
MLGLTYGESENVEDIFKSKNKLEIVTLILIIAFAPITLPIIIIRNEI